MPSDAPEERTSPRRSGRVLGRVALAFGSLAITLALLELVATARLGDRFVRGAHLGNDWKVAGRIDPELGWSGRPNARGRVRSGSMDYTIALNSAGFRDPERALQKPAGTARVVVLGDSVAWGWGVEQGERFSDLLEARLGPGVEVLNLACPAHGTDQQYWTLIASGFGYQPDAVLLCFVLNDVPEALAAETYGMRKPRFVRAPDGEWSVEGRPVAPQDPAWVRAARSLGRTAIARSALLTWILGRSADGEPDAEEEAPRRHRQPSPEELELVRGFADQLVDPESAPRHALELVARACRERGVPLVVTHVAHKHDRYLYEPRFPCPEDMGPAPFATYTTRRIQEACNALGVEFVPLDDRFLAACRAGRRLHVGDGHPNAEGHRIVADALEGPLRAALERER